jgi:hypothetical protein
MPDWHSAAPAATFLSSPDAKNEPPLSLRLTPRIELQRGVSLRFAPRRSLAPQPCAAASANKTYLARYYYQQVTS